MDTSFTPFEALLGGSLIGLSAVLMMLINGRIAGISGIVGGSVKAGAGDKVWRAAFVLGLITAPFFYAFVTGPIVISFRVSTPVLLAGGALVGIGTQLGSGCTSGHGVCGIARFSKRSIAATCTFMVAAVITVYVVRHGGL